jgi:hypothetical protein
VRGRQTITSLLAWEAITLHHLLVEPAIVPDIFCSGLAEAEDLGDGNFRFTLYAKQKSFQSLDGHSDLVIVARLIMPLSAVMQSIQITKKAIGQKCCGEEWLDCLAH